MYVKKTDSPTNGIQIYIDGHRYRSIFEAAVDTGLTYWLIAAKLKQSSGGPCFIKKHEIISESWLLNNVNWLLARLADNKEKN